MGKTMSCGFNEVPTLENSFAYPPGITGTSTTQDNLAQLPTNFQTEVDPLSDAPCIPENGLESEPQTFLCPMCCEKQFSLVDLQQHISRYIWGSLKCPVCDEVCVGLEILAVHLDEHHSYQEMLVPEIRLWTNEDKVRDTAEESVNVSCGDVTEVSSNTLNKSSNLGLDLENTAQKTTSQLQSTDSVSSDIETNDNYYLSVMADSSCAPDTHMSGVEQNSATGSENVSTSSTCEIENCVEALRGVNSNPDASTGSQPQVGNSPTAPAHRPYVSHHGGRHGGSPDTHFGGNLSLRPHQPNVHNSGTSELDHMACRVFNLVFSSNLNDEQCFVLTCVEDPYKVLVTGCSVVTLFRSSLSGQAEKILSSLTSDGVGGAPDAVECTPINKFKKTPTPHPNPTTISSPHQ
uniref:(California timema) hypothetical protein n=1 Tax=Timema californicum TaxID=61474 RepID=A0A7R9JAG3_TIMCA|nr:unnamed protein product [Timema californicum]